MQRSQNAHSSDYRGPSEGPMQTNVTNLEDFKKNSIDAIRTTRAKLQDATAKIHKVLKRYRRDEALCADEMLLMVELVQNVSIVSPPIRIIH